MIDMFVVPGADGRDEAHAFIARADVFGTARDEMVVARSRAGVEMALARELVARGVPDQPWRSFIERRLDVETPVEVAVPAPVTDEEPITADAGDVALAEAAAEVAELPRVVEHVPSLNGPSLFGLSKLTISDSKTGALVRRRWRNPPFGYATPCDRCDETDFFLGEICLRCLWGR